MNRRTGHRSSPAGLRAGFTLVELLVVAGVLAVLVALLSVVLGRAADAARQVRCESNLRQWALAALAYAGQNDGDLPRRGQGVQVTSVVDRPADWFNALPPLMGMEPYSSLAARHAVPRPDDRRIWSCTDARDVRETNFFSYAMNMRLSTWLTPAPDSIRRVGPVESMVFMADGPAGFCSTLPADAPYSPQARNHGRVNIAFLDGHVGNYGGAEVGCDRGDPLRSDVRWVVPGSPWSGPEH